MAMRLGIVTGQEIAKNRDGAGDRLLLQVTMSNSDDVQTVEMVGAPGEDSNPPDGSLVLITDMGAAFKAAIAANDGIAASMGEGEKKLYSIDAGAIAAYVSWLSTGVLELNGNADFAVRYNALETAFNQLQADFDAHTHLYAPGPGTPTQTGAPPASSADITPAKVNMVTLP